jgi:hypothetical protein
LNFYNQTYVPYYCVNDSLAKILTVADKNGML